MFPKLGRQGAESAKLEDRIEEQKVFAVLISVCTKSGFLLNSSLYKELNTLQVLLRKIFQD